MEKYAIILAGGKGERAGGGVPKQFHLLAGRPLLWYSMRAFLEADPATKLILVVHPGYIGVWNEIWKSLPQEERFIHHVTSGGKCRPESVAMGLMTVAAFENGEDAVVLIHDGARPLLDAGMIRRGIESLNAGHGSIPVIKAVNSLRRLETPALPIDECRSESVNRAEYVEVQTPQIFHFSTIARLYDLGKDLSGFTDDASIAEAAGVPIDLYEGAATNIKVTHPLDFAIAETILEHKANS